MVFAAKRLYNSLLNTGSRPIAPRLGAKRQLGLDISRAEANPANRVHDNRYVG